MKNALMIITCLVGSMALADVLQVSSYADIVNNNLNIDLTFPTTCVDWTSGATPKFNQIQVEPVLLADASLDPHRIAVRAFNQNDQNHLVKLLIVDLSQPANFVFDPNQSGDPMFRLQAIGTDAGTNQPDQLSCGNSY